MLWGTTLVLIRHADAAHNGGSTLCGGYCDIPLTSLGWRQVELLRERLVGEPQFAVCYSSPLKRAIETATAAPPALAPLLLNSLREIHAGELDGLPIETVQARYPEAWRRNLALSDDDFAWPGGETYSAFRQRAVTAMHEIASSYAGQRVLLFTHAGIISQVVGSLAGTPAARWDLHRPANASITEVRWTAAGGELIAFDDRRHLEAMCRA